jgi:hypothetical protein
VNRGPDDRHVEFAAYTGDLRTASGLSPASALQCTVPAGRAPAAGEQLNVADNLPDPSPANGRYYVAAVRQVAQIRAGRSMIGDVMQGRNAAALPTCPESTRSGEHTHPPISARLSRGSTSIRR